MFFSYRLFLFCHYVFITNWLTDTMCMCLNSAAMCFHGLSLTKIEKEKGNVSNRLQQESRAGKKSKFYLPKSQRISTVQNYYMQFSLINL